jgi:phytoene dehydrogenase-like protein
MHTLICKNKDVQSRVKAGNLIWDFETISIHSPKKEETLSKSSVIIIGAGLGGLSTGAYAQMNGYQCQIFEHARHPGGVAAEWKRQGYTIDGGIHFYMGYRPGRPDHDLYRELGIYQEDQYLEITNYGRFLDPAAGRSLDITQDLDQLAATLKDISPKDGAGGFARALEKRYLDLGGEVAYRSTEICCYSGWIHLRANMYVSLGKWDLNTGFGKRFEYDKIKFASNYASRRLAYVNPDE